MVSSGGGGGARHGVVAAWASFFSSRIGLDCQVRWGGQFSGEKLEWLLSKGFKIIVDLWEEDVKDDLYLLAVQEAVSLGKIEVVNIPVEIGTAPSAKQVQRLTEVVSDSVKKPIYLHCQEGNVASGITNGKPSSNGASTSVEERFTLDKFGQSKCADQLIIDQQA
ncbi:hypothetical protein OsI_35421 [Oryza sativa Indica Group]|uniref:DSP-PTPase phosphatase fused to NAD+ Kinase domain-containing protein n=1 Tax=Oryza sativa subsp. indica TaxID=39946 RepID=B8BJJ4_ORYSI|nr:hypothetical protein OsI_35421 [Oryza sativa Indica Group]